MFDHYQDQESVAESPEESQVAPADVEPDAICDADPDELEALGRADHDSAPAGETGMDVEESAPAVQEPVSEDVHLDPVEPEPAPRVVTPPPVEPTKSPSSVSASASSGLSLKITPPGMNPAGPPPSSVDIMAEKQEAELSSEYGGSLITSDTVTTEADDEDDKKDKGGRKNKKKKKKKNRPEIWARQAQEAERRKREEEERSAGDVGDVEVEYVQEELQLDPLDPMYRTFSKIFANFKLIDPKEAQAMQEEEVRICKINLNQNKIMMKLLIQLSFG